MSHLYFRRFAKIYLLILIFSGIGNSLLGAISNPQLKEISHLIKQFQADSLMIHGQWGMTVIDTETGETLVEVNPHKSLAPASCLKLVTSAAGLTLLGENFQFETRLEYSGKLDRRGNLAGNLYIVGGGDPALGTERIDSVLALPELFQTWVDTITSLGVRQISGDIIGDDTYFDEMTTPGNWTWSDMGNYYGAGTSGLCIHENYYKLVFQPGRTQGQKTYVIRTEPVIPGLNFINSVSTGAAGSGDNAYIYAAPGQWTCLLRGTIPAQPVEFMIKGAMPDPAKICARLLYDRLKDAQINIQGSVLTTSKSPRFNDCKNQRQIISTIKSPRLKDIVYWLNKKSINLYAEQILKQLGKKYQAEGSFEAGLEVVEDFFEQFGIPTGGLNLSDGSGLSRFNSITTTQLARLLQAMTRQACFDAYYFSLPIAGDASDVGTVKRWCRNTAAAHNARVKTGLIQRVRSHAGYVTNAAGHLLCFAMIANDYTGSRRQIEQFHAKILIRLAQLKDF